MLFAKVPKAKTIISISASWENVLLTQQEIVSLLAPHSFSPAWRGSYGLLINKRGNFISNMYGRSIFCPWKLNSVDFWKADFDLTQHFSILKLTFENQKCWITENLEAGKAVCERCREVYHKLCLCRKTYKARFLLQFHPLLHTEHCSVYLVTLTVKMLMYYLCLMLPLSYAENTQKRSELCQLEWTAEFKKGYITKSI